MIEVFFFGMKILIESVVVMVIIIVRVIGNDNDNCINNDNCNRIRNGKGNSNW